MRKAFLFVLLAIAGAGMLVLSAGAEETGPPESGIVAYYFHGNVRCATCRKLEAYSEEAIGKGVAKEITAGQLQWQPVNTDEPGNKHFIEQFELVSKAVVLVEYRDGKIARWQNLKLIWQLVGDKDGFITYVRESTGEFLTTGAEA